MRLAKTPADAPATTNPAPVTGARGLTAGQWLDGATLALLVVALCTQRDLFHYGEDTFAQGKGFVTKVLKISLPDLMFALTVLWFGVRTTFLGAWKRLWWPPLPCWALIFALVLSFSHSVVIWNSILQAHKPITPESKEAIAELVQWTGFFLVAPWLFVNLILDRRGTAPVLRRDLAVRSLFFGALVSAVWALVQWQQLGDVDKGLTLLVDANADTHRLPSGLFHNAPNVYAAFLAIVTPFLVEAETDNERQQSRFWLLAIVILAVAIVTVISYWALGILMIGLLVATMVRQGEKKARLFRLALAAVVALGTWTYYHAPGRLAGARNDFSRLDSPQQIVENVNKKDKKRIANVLSPGQEVKKQYIEWHVASQWNLPKERAFATGIGPGNYQGRIGTLYGYDALPSSEKVPPDSNNLWLVQAVSIGVLGVGALLWMVTYFLGMAWRAARENRDDWLGAAVVASLVAWLLVNNFHALIVRGPGLLPALLFAFAVAAASKTSNESAAQKVLTPRKS